MSTPESATRTNATPESSSPEVATQGRSQNPPAFQLMANPIQRETPEGETAETAVEKYVVSDGKAIIRDEEFKKLDPEQTIPKWTEVQIIETKKSGSTEYAKVKSYDGATEYGWTAKSNLYSLSWNPKDNETAYTGVSDVYNEQMQAVDPVATRADLIKSGTGVKALADKYYPNSTDPEKLASDFKTKVDAMIAGFSAQGISASKSAGLRHPLRSTIFHYAIAVAAASSDDIIHEANAVMTKYGIPIDWSHTATDGSIDRATCKSKAEEVKTEFSISKDAAAGIKDFGGTISNHNNGRAVDLTLTFSFSTPKTITVGDKTYIVDPAVSGNKNITNIESDPLTLFGKEQYGLTRALPNDGVHWSVSGR